MHLPEILLIEDAIDDRQLFGRAVAASGIAVRVTYALTAAEAVSRLNRLGEFSDLPLPSLIILDLGLPGITGRALLQVVRNAYGPRLIPVIVLSGSDSPLDREACAALGISAYVVKPATFPDLIAFAATIPEFLQQAGAARRQTVPPMTPAPRRDPAP